MEEELTKSSGEMQLRIARALAMLGSENIRTQKKLAGDYEKEWYKKMGKRHVKLARVKMDLLKVSDEEYNSGAHTLAAYQQKEMTMSKIFTVCLGKFPRLVWALRHLM